MQAKKFMYYFLKVISYLFWGVFTVNLIFALTFPIWVILKKLPESYELKLFTGAIGSIVASVLFLMLLEAIILPKLKPDENTS